MKAISAIYNIPFPDTEIAENITFSCTFPFGLFKFKFKWLNERWDCWVTLPSGEIRQAGVNANTPGWTGFNDYGLVFNTNLPTIDYDSLFETELRLLIWQ